jgi:hypothetical protein
MGLRSELMPDTIVDTSNCTWSSWTVCSTESVYRCSRSKTFELLPLQNQTDNIASKQLCHGNAGRVDTETCYDGLCPKWVPGNWTDCSPTCNTTQLPPWEGYQTRTLVCQDSDGVFYQSAVCENIYGLSAKPLSEQPCACSHQAVNFDPYGNKFEPVVLNGTR